MGSVSISKMSSSVSSLTFGPLENCPIQNSIHEKNCKNKAKSRKYDEKGKKQKLNSPSTSPWQYSILSPLLSSSVSVSLLSLRRYVYWEKLLSTSTDVTGSHIPPLSTEGRSGRRSCMPLQKMIMHVTPEDDHACHSRR